MNVKRFEAADMQEALRLVKHELGPQAVILSTRHIRKGKGAFGMFGRPMVEVTAAVERDVPIAASPRAPASPLARQAAMAYAGASAPELAPPAQQPDLSRSLDPLQRDMEQMKDMLQRLSLQERFTPNANLSSLEREFGTMREMMEMLLRKHQDSNGPLFEPPVMPCYQRLLASGMQEDLARRLTEKIQSSLTTDKLADEHYVRQHCANMLMKVTPISGPLQARSGEQIIAAFVGPTGVGKTTTIAKLAAHYALGEKRQVALLTLDTYRLAAIEQLRVFAKIIGLPVDTALTAVELEQALLRYQDKDVVLIDTAGRSQRDTIQMAELTTFFTEEKRASVHLVLSATSSLQNIHDTVSRFKPLGLGSLIFTKLDESNAFGAVLGTALKAHLPLSYFTTGQRVPEDIEVATPERVVDLILNVSQWHNEAFTLERG